MEPWLVVLLSALITIYAMRTFLSKGGRGRNSSTSRGRPSSSNASDNRPTCAPDGARCDYRTTRCCSGRCRNDKCASSQQTRRSKCFSADTTVMTENGSVVPIIDVNVGDRIWTVSSDGKHPVVDTVALVSKRNASAPTTFVRVALADGGDMCVTPDHYVYVVRNDRLSLIKAQAIDPATDMMLRTCGPVHIKSISLVEKPGYVNLYMSSTPYLTINGGILASPLCDDGVSGFDTIPVLAASTLTSAVVSWHRLVCQHA